MAPSHGYFEPTASHSLDYIIRVICIITLGKYSSLVSDGLFLTSAIRVSDDSLHTVACVCIEGRREHGRGSLGRDARATKTRRKTARAHTARVGRLDRQRLQLERLPRSRTRPDAPSVRPSNRSRASPTVQNHTFAFLTHSLSHSRAVGHPSAVLARWQELAADAAAGGGADSSGANDDGAPSPSPLIGSTGSRLLSGNSAEHEAFEEWLAAFHGHEVHDTP